MGKATADITMSLDGFIAGPNDCPGNGRGDGGDVLVVDSPAVIHLKYRVVK
jgi:hypothetical protein